MDCYDLCDVFRRVSTHIWKLISEYTPDEAGLLPFKTCATLRNKFRGQCGLAQCIAGYALQDIGLKVRPIATQSLQAYWHGHAALSIEAQDADIIRYYLLDPTFIQFCGENIFGEEPYPGSILDQDTRGREIVDALLKDGYIEFMPSHAQLYLASFCQRTSRMSALEAFDFLRNPPHHPYHYCFNPGDERFSRDNLKSQGLLISMGKLNIAPH